MVGKYKHIFFDLDRTIWDFEGNLIETLLDIQEKFNLMHIEPAEFQQAFGFYNEQHWQLYREGKIRKEDLRNDRFKKTLDKFGIRDKEMASKMAAEYLRIGPTKTGLIPFAMEILELLHKQYSLYIITNGFVDVQSHKLKNSGVYSYFKKVISSEHAHSSKPKPQIFRYALSTVNAKKKECLMVGDDLELDILGARDFGIDQVYYNPKALAHTEKLTFEIKSLDELKNILPL